MQEHRSTEVLTAGPSQQLPSSTDLIRSRGRRLQAQLEKPRSTPYCVTTRLQPQASQKQCLMDTVSQLLQ